jgi:7-carboxy-7-deazaguanine synthase
VKLSELYTSIQGEGPRVGQPVQFMRFAGCNLRCPSWPCDTQHAIDPEKYRHEWQTVTSEELASRVSPWPKRIVYTGGEPFLQPKPELMDLTEILLSRGYTVEAFTNGTLRWPRWARGGNISMVMDWKLPGSGEKTTTPIRDVNLASMTHHDSIKFTIAAWEDFKLAISLWHNFMTRLAPDTEDIPDVYCGVVWGQVKESELADWIMAAQLPWIFNTQVHNFIWPRDQRGT